MKIERGDEDLHLAVLGEDATEEVEALVGGDPVLDPALERRRWARLRAAAEDAGLDRLHHVALDLGNHPALLVRERRVEDADSGAGPGAKAHVADDPAGQVLCRAQPAVGERRVQGRTALDEGEREARGHVEEAGVKAVRLEVPGERLRQLEVRHRLR